MASQIRDNPIVCLTAAHADEQNITFGSKCILWGKSTSDRLISVTKGQCHYGYVIMGAIASQITSLTLVYWAVYSDADQRKHQSSASLAFVWGIHRGPVNSPHKWPVMRKMFPFDDVIMDVEHISMSSHRSPLTCNLWPCSSRHSCMHSYNHVDSVRSMPSHPWHADWRASQTFHILEQWNNGY